MADRSRIPKSNDGFNIYITTTASHLETGTPTGAVRLGLSNAQTNQWLSFRDEWNTVYSKYTDLGQRTTAVTKEKNSLKKAFTAFAKIPLTIILASANLTNSDRLTFNLPPAGRSYSRRGRIDGIPFVSLKAIGGAWMKVNVRRETDANRPSMHKLADAIEFRYMVSDPFNYALNPPALDSLPHIALSKKALWVLQLDDSSRGKIIVGYVRWINLSKPANNSPWSPVVASFIA